MKLNAKDVFKPALILFAICLVVTALLAGTNELTKAQIKQQDIQNAEASRKVVLPQAEKFDEAKSENSAFFIGKSGDQVVGYVFTTESKGYGGAMQIMTGIEKDGKISGVVILSMNETPGLGENAKKDSFRNQFKQNAPEKGFQVIKSGSKADGQIQAMTGATITSKAVTNAVNEAVKQYQKVKGGE